MDPPALLTVNKQSNLTCRCSSPANSSEGGESETTTTREDGGKFSLNYFKADFSDLKCGGNKPWCMKLVKASANTSIYPWDPLVHFHQAFASSFMSAYQPFALESVSRSGIVWKKSWVIWYVLRQSDLMKNALSVRAGFFFFFLTASARLWHEKQHRTPDQSVHTGGGAALSFYNDAIISATPNMPPFVVWRYLIDSWWVLLFSQEKYNCWTHSHLHININIDIRDIIIKIQI